MKRRFVVSFLVIGLAHVSLSALVQTAEYSTDSWSSTPWSSRVSSTDLINNGQETLSSYDAPEGSYGLNKTGMNDGSSTEASADNTYYASTLVTFPVVATYYLDTSINTLGYNITSIESFMGWHEHTAHQADQSYSVEVSTVDNSDYSLLATVNYNPFIDDDQWNASYHYSHVEIAEDSTGILASGIDSIRFTFSSPGTDGRSPGTVIRELDVYGTATVVPEPAAIAMLVAVTGICIFVRRRLWFMWKR